MDYLSLLGDLPNEIPLAIMPYDRRRAIPIPLFLSIKAGFPSPAEDYLDSCLDLNDLVVKHPAATFFVRVDGHSMIDAGIDSDDVLVVDRSVEPGENSIVVAIVDGDFTVKRISKCDNQLFLMPANQEHDPIEITEEMSFEVWGVVTYVIHQLN